MHRVCFFAAGTAGAKPAEQDLAPWAALWCRAPPGGGPTRGSDGEACRRPGAWGGLGLCLCFQLGAASRWGLAWALEGRFGCGLEDRLAGE